MEPRMKTIGPVIYYPLNLETLHPTDRCIQNYLQDYHCIYTDSCRTALRLLMTIIPEGEILVPDYSCSSISRLVHPGLSLVNYRMQRDFSLDYEDIESRITDHTRAIVVNQFCGKLFSGEDVAFLLNLKERFGLLLIEDTTQSLLSAPLTFGDYACGSLYKWAPIISGGVLYSRAPLPAELYENTTSARIFQKGYGMILRSISEHETFAASDTARMSLSEAATDSWYEEYEHLLMTEDGCPEMSEFSKFLLSCFDIFDAKQKRMENTRALEQFLTPDPHGLVRPVFSTPISEQDCLLCYPLYITDCDDPTARDDLKAFLKSQQIEAVSYWNFDHSPWFGKFEESRDISAHMLNLPLDHRYDETDMKRMADAIHTWQSVAK